MSKTMQSGGAGGMYVCLPSAYVQHEKSDRHFDQARFEILQIIIIYSYLGAP